MKNSIDFHVFIVSFYYFSLGNNTSCTFSTLTVRVRPLLQHFSFCTCIFLPHDGQYVRPKHLILNEKRMSRVSVLRLCALCLLVSVLCLCALCLLFSVLCLCTLCLLVSVLCLCTLCLLVSVLCLCTLCLLVSVLRLCTVC